LIEAEQQGETFLDFDAQQTSLRVTLHRLFEERHPQRIEPRSASAIWCSLKLSSGKLASRFVATA
jgi:hypothetical protein